MTEPVESRAVRERTEAYRTLGKALLRATGADPAEEDLARVQDAMDALARSETEGGVCAAVPESWKGGIPPIAAIVSGTELPAEPRPLVADSAGRLYFERSYGDELRLARAIKRYACAPGTAVTAAQEEFLARLEEADYAEYGRGMAREAFRAGRARQDEAVRSAVAGRFSVICGGPGTGKTTTVARVLECLLLEEPGLRVALAAPTGKAAARVGQSLLAAASRKGLFPALSRALAERRVEEHTLHKWLSTRQENGEWPSKRNPFSREVLVVDESSMMDFDLAVSLFAVLRPEMTRVILLGDREQLDAVGPGSVFGDICQSRGALGDRVTELTESHRFTAHSAVGRAARAILAGDPDGALPALAAGGAVREETAGGNAASFREVRLQPGVPLPKAVREWLDISLEGYVQELLGLLRNPPAPGAVRAEPAGLWKAVNAFRALAAQREGPMSVEAVNGYAAERVREALSEGGFSSAAEGDFYAGRILIVRRNSPRLGVYNGDVGVVLPGDEPGKAPVVYFGDSERRFLSSALLPEHDTAFAITVHQSQGSEYDHVAVLLPPKADSGLATRELLYTGVTRAKKTVQVFGTEAALRASVLARSERAGGLADRLEAA